MPKVLLVEDELPLAQMLCAWLARERHTVDHVATGQDALDRLRFDTYDLVILDYLLPDKDGLSVLKEFRSTGGETPVLILTGSKTQATDKVHGLDSGADDYLLKPFDPVELAARMRALMRRTGSRTSNVLRWADIELDTKSHQVKRNGRPISLLPRELALLEFFMRNPNQVFSSEAILTRVWSSESDVSPDTVRSYITRLRSKLDADGESSLIRTVHRVGYMLAEPDANS